LTWMGDRWPSISQRVRPATARSSRFCLTLDRTSRLGLRWVTKATTPYPIARPPASAASVP
jgi:hypothetical protein